MSLHQSEPTGGVAILLRSLSILPTIELWDSLNEKRTATQMPGVVNIRVVPPKDALKETIESDELVDTLSYFDLAERVLNGINGRPVDQKFESMEDVAELVAMLTALQISELPHRKPQGKDDDGFKGTEKDMNTFLIQVSVEIPKMVRFADRLSISINRCYHPSSSDLDSSISMVDTLDQVFIENISAFAIIGLLPRERLSKQKVNCNLLIFISPCGSPPHGLDLHRISKSVFSKISESEFRTVEALANSVATEVIFQCNREKVVTQQVKVRIEKPEAVSYALGAGVEITKSV